ncbi:Uncharacterised protein [BD1-7 clade bacterium]|uniref:Uncharacterized protein n=1 Tax=BD1-7 clade bacterium TaxID=2029982 RepID=A0A5S9PWT1_9GAMM|nr:Uncharacterised protein [BD1-7 clade bacterium]CAA0109063.1 Uncharacterised protein [BD1-7 clade bacterium]
MDKRAFLGLVGGAALVAPVGLHLLGSGAGQNNSDSSLAGINPDAGEVPPTQGRGGNRALSTRLQDQFGNIHRLFSDQPDEHITLMHFMSLDGLERSGKVENLKAIAGHLKDDLNRDVRLYTITTQPDIDTQSELFAFSDRHQLPEGWYLLTGSWVDVFRIGDKFTKGHWHHNSADEAQRVSTNLLHYGLPKHGLWGAFGIGTEPEFAASRVSWLKGALVKQDELTRAGPSILA